MSVGDKFEEAAGRIELALQHALEWSGIDGEHHKMWVIDQMVRCLTGCQLETATFVGAHGVEYDAQVLGESAEYRSFVSDYNEGEDGPNTYEWDEGIAP